MAVKIQVLKAEDNFRNSFLADEDKVGDQVVATLEVDGKEFSAMADTSVEAVAELREVINRHFGAQKHIAKVELDKAEGIYFFD